MPTTLLISPLGHRKIDWTADDQPRVAVWFDDLIERGANIFTVEGGNGSEYRVIGHVSTGAEAAATNTMPRGVGLL
jgi:hypothetical protein